MHAPRDVASIRLDNALRLFDEFVRHTIKHPDAATLRGLERRFAERLQIQPSYWSQIKSRSRQIGERLARQFEQCCQKPYGWMDLVHDEGGDASAGAAATGGGADAPGSPGSLGSGATPVSDRPLPQDDDERFIVGLVLTYYRRHPQRARTRLLDLLGEVLVPAPEPPVAPTAPLAPTPPAPAPRPGSRPGSPAVPAPPPPPSDPHSLWLQSQAGVSPLAPKKKR
jgi:hypothetical protein